MILFSQGVDPNTKAVLCTYAETSGPFHKIYGWAILNAVSVVLIGTFATLLWSLRRAFGASGADAKNMVCVEMITNLHNFI